MAEINVQPKKKSSNSFLPWLLLLLGVVALIWFLTRDKSDNSNSVTTTEEKNSTSTNTANSPSGWDAIDFNAPKASYDEITNKDIEVRGNENYGIYGLGENILFNTDQSSLKVDAADHLKQIVASINKRYTNSEVRVYGYTDAQGSENHNDQLAQQRAETVRKWLSENGINPGSISVHAIGEQNPVATNSTASGRQQNRRVEIVALNSTK
jgi:outer membrane protein OmpA-like peptidoglycan-associated protein